jgi:hypothetical protein
MTSLVRSTPVKFAVKPLASAMMPPVHAVVVFHASPLPSQVPEAADADEMTNSELLAAMRGNNSFDFRFMCMWYF